MEKQYLNLMQYFEGYVRNYRRMNFSHLHNRSMFTKREIDYFDNLGQMLGFDTFIEDSKFDKVKGRSRPMDLAWWKYDVRYSDEQYQYLALHLERENVWNKDVDTIEKLFSRTEEGYIPHNVIGVQYIESPERINYLNDLIILKNVIQNSNALMVYRYYDNKLELERVCANSFTPQGLDEVRLAICKQDETGSWFMAFEEEYSPFREEMFSTK
ncbi:hypothetical protein [Bacillus sp. CECT 9360]|uniref:hypothetical protein n=1 Tax=Bacillus sp. CECT 9360 TaxID=2845821 RepID=UPI001E3A166D|nr:hypothetical protein [Bacillus sp. CECT 9360]CAH0345174.1 hypothetical protein BCI9360_01453 [Bacillus sp. CECT 9360]